MAEAKQAKQRAHIVIVDDEESMRAFLAIMLEKEGYRVSTFPRAMQFLTRLDDGDPPELVITDFKMPDMDGLDLLERVKHKHPDTEVIVVTAFGTAESAVEAMRLGAYDYIAKPFHNDELKLLVRNAVAKHRLARENIELKAVLKQQHRLGALIGKSPAMRRVFELIRRIADSRATVLIQGESGTGKEVVARCIHQRSSSKKNHPFVAVNCSAIPENLLESELFGYKKGAFTGADRNKQGLFSAASGGSVFLDEIAELPSALQAKLLRVLQEKRIQPLGATSDLPFDARVIVASNKDLKREVADGRFREDLYYRLHVMPVQLPPLRERVEDIPALAQVFLKQYSLEAGKRLEGFEERAFKALLNYHYPGNVRELENIVARAVVLEEGARVSVDSLPEEVTRFSAGQAPSSQEFPEDGVDLPQLLDNTERRYLLLALDRGRGSHKKAAALLHLTPRSLRYRLKKHGLS